MIDSCFFFLCRPEDASKMPNPFSPLHSSFSVAFSSFQNKGKTSRYFFKLLLQQWSKWRHCNVQNRGTALQRLVLCHTNCNFANHRIVKNCELKKARPNLKQNKFSIVKRCYTEKIPIGLLLSRDVLQQIRLIKTGMAKLFWFFFIIGSRVCKNFSLSNQ